ncbi:hypothetical protein AQUCO_01400158v1 [Aquilegia coerulea]|uniref:Ribosomal protein S13 n=1 Tax=Aquilegia coerulea TaxID=218851 RepID=A0A2G5DUU8_AQUCA|nr:hypothetical protein AQUCO_01400158v1 [Aquilegia coerulea]
MAQALAMPVAPSLFKTGNPHYSLTTSTTKNLRFPTSNKIGGLSIRCARVGGVEIPNNKRIEYSLQYIHVSKYMIEGDLRRFNGLAIRRLKEIQCYRGIRHIKGLPCRGQRTKNNCRTLKGKRVAIANKKKAPR